MFDLAKAVAHNARVLGLGALPQRTQERFAALLANYQGEVGLEPDGAYDRGTEAALNDLLGKLAPAIAAVPATPGLGGSERFTSAVVCARAQRMVEECAKPGSPNRYRLGGGSPFTEGSAFLRDNTCDCSGFVAWAEGYRRGDGDWNTDRIVDDCWKRRGTVITDRPGPRKLFEPVEPDDLRAGDVIVFAGPDGDHDGRRDYPGHCGVIVGVNAGVVLGADDWAENVRVAHCRWASRAVRVTDATLFDKPRTIVARCKRVRYA